ncbi:GntR family transcriptional regulator [Pseudomonas sp. ABC1]|uniref:GntR family transcriptional regulator n=1 Tax=Pseudomonas sp. ABC1 TaxID=2748080 RepID=UPI0015C312F2|nr:GntR family transcriptional regulator [Pseudomonas sp. ABC1]QLF92952.1 GntR family transcriptional regulator [Pseudomonas sp. ABC1]
MQLAGTHPAPQRPQSLAARIYASIKDDIGHFRLLPGDRFSEGEIAQRMAVSRTPVRQALDRLAREGYLQVHFRSGWQVRPFDFEHFEELYEVRITLELEALQRLCLLPSESLAERLGPLCATWLVDASQRQTEERTVQQLDEDFHCQLLELAGNHEMARIHREISEKIRIIRRLDFTQGARVTATYEEHGQILRTLLERRCQDAQQLLKDHIETSKAEVRSITLHRLHSARQQALAEQRQHLATDSQQELSPCKDAV